MTREKSAIYNIISNIMLQCILAISGFFLPKLILSYFGSTMNGLINSITQFLTYAGLVEMGVANAAVVVLYKPIAEKNYLSISEIVSSVKKKYIISGVLYTCIVFILAILYPVIISNQLDYGFVFSMVLIISGVSIIDFFLIGKYKVLLIASQKYYIINFVRVIATTFLIIGSCLLLMQSSSLQIVKGFAIITHLSEAIIIKIYVRVTYPNVSFKVNTEKKMIHQQSNALIHQISSVIVYNTDLVVLTLFLSGESLKEVSVYTVYALAFGIINNLMTSFTTSFDATFGDMIARKENNRLRKFYNGYEFWYLIVLYSVFSCFMVLIIPFVRCYTNGIIDVNYIRPEVGILFGINGILAELKDPLAVVVRANGDFKQTQYFAISEAFVNIIISIILVKPLGIVGVLIGTIISHVIADVGFIIYSNKKLINRNPGYSVKNNFINTIILIFVFSIEFNMVYSITKWVNWILASIIIFLINLFIFVLINGIFDSENFKYGKDYICDKIKNK